MSFGGDEPFGHWLTAAMICGSLPPAGVFFFPVFRKEKKTPGGSGQPIFGSVPEPLAGKKKKAFQRSSQPHKRLVVTWISCFLLPLPKAINHFPTLRGLYFSFISEAYVGKWWIAVLCHVLSLGLALNVFLCLNARWPRTIGQRQRTPTITIGLCPARVSFLS